MCAHMCVAGSERKSEDLTGAAKRDGPLVPRTAEAARGPLDVASSAAGPGTRVERGTRWGSLLIPGATYRTYCVYNFM